MKEILATVAGILVVGLLIAFVMIPAFSKTETMGSEALTTLDTASAVSKGDVTLGTAVLDYINKGTYTIIVRDYNDNVIANPGSWVDESGQFTSVKSFDTNGNLSAITFTQINQSRTE